MNTGYKFSIKKPRDVKKAIEKARSKVKGHGGTFSGNEEQGRLSVKGIEGRYRVSELVIVTIIKAVYYPFFGY